MPTLANGSGALRINVPRGSSLIIRNQSGVETVTGSSAAREDATYALGAGAFVYGPQTASSDLSISTTGVLTYDIVAGDPTPASTPAAVARSASTGQPSGLIDPATGQPLGGGGAVYYPTATTYGGIMDAVAKAQAAIADKGAATIVLLPELYDIASAGQGLPVLSGLTYEGGGYSTNADLKISGGTIIQGNGLFDLFAGNTADRASPLPNDAPNSALYHSERITGFHMRNMALKRGRYGIKVGALYRSGLFNSSLRDLQIAECSAWGLWLENMGNVRLQSIDDAPTAGSAGSMMFAASGATIWNHGNMSLIDIHSDGGDYKTRGIVFMARGSVGTNLNDINVFRMMRSASGQLNGIRAAATMSNGSSSITVPDASAFPLDMPVTFTTSANGFTQWQTYFVVSSSGTTIQIADSMGGSPINANNSNAVQICCFGQSAVEIIGYGTNNFVQPSKFTGLDLEGYANSMLHIQRSSVDVELGMMFTGRGTAVASTLVCRSGFGRISGNGNSSVDLDGATVNNTMFAGMNVDVSQGRLQNNPLGLVKYSDGKLGVNLWPAINQGSDMSLRGIGVPGMAHVYPEHPISQRIWQSNSTTIGMFGPHMGSGSFVGTANAAWTLPTLSGAAGGATNTWLGATFEVANASTTAGVTLTLNTAAGQPFNRQAGKTSAVMQPGQSISVRAQTNGGSEWFWQVVGNNGATI